MAEEKKTSPKAEKKADKSAKSTKSKDKKSKKNPFNSPDSCRCWDFFLVHYPANLQFSVADSDISGHKYLG